MNSVAPVDYTQEGTAEKFNTIVQLDPGSKADLAWWSSLNRKDISTPVVPTSAISDHRVRCIQQGLGCCTKGTHPDRRSLDSRGSNTSHQLSGTVSSLSCDQGLWEELERHSSPTSYGQHNSSLVCQSQGRYNFSSAVQFSNQDVDLVHFSEHHFDSRTPLRPPQCDGRPGITADQGSLRLDAQSPGVP